MKEVALDASFFQSLIGTAVERVRHKNRKVFLEVFFVEVIEERRFPRASGTDENEGATKLVVREGKSIYIAEGEFATFIGNGGDLAVAETNRGILFGCGARHTTKGAVKKDK